MGRLAQVSVCERSRRCKYFLTATTTCFVGFTALEPAIVRQEAQPSVEALVSAVGVAHEDFVRAGSILTPIVPLGPVETLYDGRQVLDEIDQVTNDVLTAISSQGLRALSRLVSIRFAAARGMLVRASSGGCPDCFTKGSVERAFEAITAETRSLMNLESLSGDIATESDASATQLNLFIGSDDEPSYTSHTSDPLKSVYLGVYRGRATKSGFREVRFPVTVDYTGYGRIACTMVPSTREGESVCRHVVP